MKVLDLTYSKRLISPGISFKVVLCFHSLFGIYLMYNSYTEYWLIFNPTIVFREIFLGNLVSQIMKSPQFEDPINTVKDLVERNITVFQYESALASTKRSYLHYNISEWSHVANNMIPARQCWGTIECLMENGSYPNYIKYHVHGNRTHAFVKGYLWNSDLWAFPDKKKWWRSNMVISFINPYSSHITNRTWIFNEVCTFSSENNLRVQIQIKSFQSLMLNFNFLFLLRLTIWLYFFFLSSATRFFSAPPHA